MKEPDEQPDKEEIANEEIVAPPENQCPHCGKEITDDADFCPHCGAALRLDESTFDTAVRRMSLVSLAGTLLTIGALGACFTLVAGGAFFGTRAIIANPLIGLSVLAIIVFVVGSFLGVFRFPKK